MEPTNSSHFSKISPKMQTIIDHLIEYPDAQFVYSKMPELSGGKLLAQLGFAESLKKEYGYHNDYIGEKDEMLKTTCESIDDN